MHARAIVQYSLLALSAGVFVLGNIGMWLTHARALALADNALQPIVINSSANFLLTVCIQLVMRAHTHTHIEQGILGVCLFGEVRGLQWCAGITLILFGTCAVAMAKHEHNTIKSR